MPQVSTDELYERDFHAWCIKQAESIRATVKSLGRPHIPPLDWTGEWTDAERERYGVDWGHIAEELEGMARRDERKVASRLERLHEHLLKLQMAHRQYPNLYVYHDNARGWKVTILGQRNRLHDLLSESLRAHAEEKFKTCYLRAVEKVSLEMGWPRSSFPQECPWTLDQLLNSRYLPEEQIDC